MVDTFSTVSRYGFLVFSKNPDVRQKKISTSATLNTLNRHLTIVTIPTRPPAAGAETRVCLPDGHPYTSADPARRPDRATYPLPKSRGGFCRRSERRADSSSYSQNPTLANTCCHCISIQRMGAALQQLMSMGAVSRKSRSGKDHPHTLWSPTDADINQPS